MDMREKFCNNILSYMLLFGHTLPRELAPFYIINPIETSGSFTIKKNIEMKIVSVKTHQDTSKSIPQNRVNRQ